MVFNTATLLHGVSLLRIDIQSRQVSRNYNRRRRHPLRGPSHQQVPARDGGAIAAGHRPGLGCLPCRLACIIEYHIGTNVRYSVYWFFGQQGYEQ